MRAPRACFNRLLAMVALVLRENARMLDLARELGFEFDTEQPDDETWRIQLNLA